jgi:DNA mismatch repair protein MutS
MTPPKKLTPAMQQYARFKKRHPECVLFFRMGDFYEMFYDDAVTAHRALGITLTERTEGVPMAGVPYHAVDSYLRRMIEQGYRVAVCDQVQDPKDAKGVVERAVTRVVTPGTLVDESLLRDQEPNLVAAVCFTESGDDAAGVIASVEVSTGAFELHDTHVRRLADDLMRIGPSELLYADTANGEVPPRLAQAVAAMDMALTPRPAWHFRHHEATEVVMKHFGVTTLDGFGLSADDPALAAAGAALAYLTETQHPDDEKRSLSYLQPPRRRVSADYVMLDAAAMRSLEIERTMRTGGVEGSLLHTIGHCRTPMGRRLLRQWLCYPLANRAAIEARHRAVAAFVDDESLAEAVREAVSPVQDVARIAGRLGLGRATPRDLVALGSSVAQVETLAGHLAGCPALGGYADRLAGMTETLPELARAIKAACVEHPPSHTREGGIIRDGYDEQLDACRELQRDASDWLARYQKKIIDETGLAKLKVGYNRVFGYYIELSRAQSGSAPDSFIRKQTLKNAERYITPELKDFETKIMTAESRAIDRERELFADLCGTAASHTAALGDFAHLVGELDILLCFAALAIKHRYVKPTMVEEPMLNIAQGRHPVLDERLGEGFVPNDCRLGVPIEEGAEPFTLGLITGPNMAGKSTYIRQVALIVLMAQMGSFVPAAAARIGLTDRIFTRLGSADELARGQSTFMVEMTETANILNHATPRSLVILDEVGRGTSTFDGVAIAWSAMEHLVAQIGCRTLFATHYHELTELERLYPTVRNVSVAVEEKGDGIAFLRKIVPGGTDKSYGIHVARIAGLPAGAVRRAEKILHELELAHASGHREEPTRPREVQPMEQLPLFTEYVLHPAILLRELRDEVDGSGE